jgi:hypothetical protein
VKGLLLAEFLEFADREFGAGVAAQLTARSGRGAGDGYRPAGHYDAGELIDLAGRPGGLVGLDRAEVLRRFGRSLFRHFAALYPVFMAGAESALAFLADIDTYVHGEMKKLYPDAQFPAFECRRLDARRLVMTYRSRRRLADLAQGLIEGCIAHFGEAIAVRREDLDPGNGEAVRFELTAALASSTESWP